MARHSTRLPICCSVAARRGRIVHGSVLGNSTASIFPHPFELRLSTRPAADLVSALGLRSRTHCLAYWRRISMRRRSSAVLLLRIGPTIISSFPGIGILKRRSLSNVLNTSAEAGSFYRLAEVFAGTLDLDAHFCEP